VTDPSYAETVKEILIASDKIPGRAKDYEYAKIHGIDMSGRTVAKGLA